MKTLTRNGNTDVFFDRLASRPNAVLFLDYDGTLAPFRTDPRDAYPYPEIIDTTNALIKCETTRVIIVTGRSVRDLLPLLPFEKTPEIWGCHGLEQYGTDQSYRTIPLPNDVIKELQKIRELSELVDEIGGRTEFKPAGLAVHWRGCDHATIQKLRITIFEFYNATINPTLYELHEFDGGLEFRVAAINKSRSVNAVLSQLPARTYQTAYLGDDITDEDAFRAIRGKGLGVLVREEFRPTGADLWLVPPHELNWFLEKWLITRGA